MSRVKRLVIVESPAKAKTIAGYLGPDFVVESSIGHIRDLPERAADVPEEIKDKSWGRLGVDVDNDFEPLYVVDADKKKVVAELKRQLKDADELLLATDEDREGEAIAWHLHEVLKPKVPVRRMVFHEITKDAIERALDETARDRRAARRRAGDAPDPRPALRLRGLARALEEGDDAASRPAACSRSRRGSSSSASASGWRSSPPTYWDILGTFDPGALRGAPRRARRRPRRHRHATSAPTASSARASSCARRGDASVALAERPATGDRSPSAASSESRTRRRPRRRS